MKSLLWTLLPMFVVGPHLLGPEFPSYLCLVIPLGMVILLDEDRLTLNELAREEGVSPSTVWRWTQRGVRGQKLEAISVAGRRVTSRQAFARWVAATNVARDGDLPTRVSTNRQQEKNQAQAEAYLKQEGF